MALNKRSKNAIIGEINITPLTDVFLVLLVIVIIVAPAATSARQDIKLPEIAKGVNQNSEWPVVEVGGDGVLYMNGDTVPEASLTERLTALIADRKEKIIVVRGDGSSRSKAVLTVLRSAQQAGCQQAYIMGVAGKDAQPVAMPNSVPPAPEPDKPEAAKTP